jgi:hypothetical protein
MNEDHPSLLVPKVQVWGCKPMFPFHNLSNNFIENFDYAPNLFYESFKFHDNHHICDCRLTPKSGIWIPILQPKTWNLNTWLCRPWRIFHMKNDFHKICGILLTFMTTSKMWITVDIVGTIKKLGGGPKVDCNNLKSIGSLFMFLLGHTPSFTRQHSLNINIIP